MTRCFFIIILAHLSSSMLAQNVGIGAITPEGRLHIKGITDATQLLIDANSTQSNANPMFRLRNNAGRDLLHLHSDDSTNIFLGINAGKLNQAILFENVRSRYNIFIGRNAGANNTEGFFNVAVGMLAFASNNTGNYHTALGQSALQNNTTGQSNTAIGHEALLLNTTGSSNTAVGYNAGVLANNLENATAIGAFAKVSASNCLVLGSNANVGIGVSAPVASLHVAGTTKIFTGATTHTGNFSNGTASVNGLEVFSSGGTTYMGLQQATGGNFYLSKPLGGSGALAIFNVGGTAVGSISTAGTTVSYNTTSDARLKKDRRPTQYSLHSLMQIGVEDYHYNNDIKQTLHTGFMAQELYKIFPQAVEPGGDDPETKPWLVDYSRLTPLLVKAVQEQQIIIDKQQGQIDALLKRVEALEKK